MRNGEGSQPGRVVVLGSLNDDLTVWVDHLPKRGETVLGERATHALGGKGLNQAVTAARLGAPVTMVGCVGDDEEGDRLLAALHDGGVDAGYVRRHSELPTGRAVVHVAPRGANTVTVIPGANAGVVFPSAVLDGAAVLLTQLEVPVEVVAAALAAARAARVRTVLNASPVVDLTPALLSAVDVLVVNETEGEALGLEQGIVGPRCVILTLGAEGAVVLGEDGSYMEVEAFPVDVVDPTGAGDAFCGALAAGLAAGDPLPEVLERAAAAGAHTVGSAGALPSLPTLAQVEARLVAGR